MKTKIKNIVQLLVAIAGSSMTSAFAQSSEPMSCQWQFDQQNEVAIHESLLCNNPVGSSSSDLLIAKKVNIPSQGFCSVNWLDGYRSELKGSIQVTGEKSACYGSAVSFKPAPRSRIVNGVTESLLDCSWTPKGNNTHQLMCNTNQGQALNLPIATKLQQKNSGSCYMIFNENSLKHIDGGTVVIDNAPRTDACDIGPAYFRAYPQKRVVNGFEQTLLQCEWRNQSEQVSMKYCTGAQGWNGDVAVAYRVGASTHSLVDALNEGLTNGQLIEDKSLNSTNPPLYFSAY
ncbi:hypothetical protein [Pseudoalteromonas luteoviolacea]|uniref:Ricin B lectin domain-containing protein n=1 Tax=Pseudoalteromonas luteoviolacea H33 TaxID=1365251 RepID=A0A167EKE0_9GAMM|nr:hypothetical protein [Pseudoalteromonas luteoviolacea]KZN50885.1 hypothetical protein N476_14685 [Pseudoalteromonas luteoviolacea H33]KZN74959.1 hypothetical protein N477_20325 [Pseudoalteromonas luteoviolacea H33-S]MBQ4879848.1 hypothetical protein [Pseudoalteromonas luteoviolacea]MBQ4908610.1 hypothetical protein [Pseudoalteromonas luteoviolacea]